jgi:hypothetical protein
MQSRTTRKKQSYKYYHNNHTADLIQLHGNFGIDVAILSSIWTKAGHAAIPFLPNAIIEEPTDDLTKKFKVFSKSHADQPNVVIVHQDGMIHCPCLMFTTSPNL